MLEDGVCNNSIYFSIEGLRGSFRGPCGEDTLKTEPLINRKRRKFQTSDFRLHNFGRNKALYEVVSMPLRGLCLILTRLRRLPFTSVVVQPMAELVSEISHQRRPGSVPARPIDP